MGAIIQETTLEIENQDGKFVPAIDGYVIGSFGIRCDNDVFNRKKADERYTRRPLNSLNRILLTKFVSRFGPVEGKSGCRDNGHVGPVATR